MDMEGEKHEKTVLGLASTALPGGEFVVEYLCDLLEGLRHVPSECLYS